MVILHGHFSSETSHSVTLLHANVSVCVRVLSCVAVCCGVAVCCTQVRARAQGKLTLQGLDSMSLMSVILDP